MKTIVFLFTLSCFVSAGDFEYVGTKKCKACHKKEETGNQHGAWLESKHAHVWDLLMNDDAHKFAKERGITVAPHKAPECVKCHSVGFGKGGYEIRDDAFFNPPKDDKKAVKAAKRMKQLENVGCEACHGPGGKYAKKKIMKGIFEGTLKAEDYGLILKPEEKLCKECHNEDSPKPKPFDYDKAVQAISHPYPDGFREK